MIKLSDGTTIRDSGFVEIKPLSDKDIKDAIEICDEQLGIGYLITDSYVHSPFNYGYFVNGELASICLAQVETPQQANERIGFARFEDPVLFINTMATLEKFKKRGYATELLSFVIDTSPVGVYGTAWQSKNGINIEFVFRRCGLEKEVELKHYFIHGTSECPDCGRPPCQCSAWLFTRE
jgi:hypothetical protein